MRSLSGIPYWRTKPTFRADCDQCDWKCYAQNADGVAAQHARRHRHVVRVEIERIVVYGEERPREGWS